MTVAVAGIAIPSFVLLPFLGLLFGIYWRWLARRGMGAACAAPSRAAGDRVLCLPPLAYVARLTRGSLLEVMRTPVHPDGVRQGPAAAHGHSLRHALRPALLPVASYLAPAVASIMTGSLVVESIAGLPGIGRYLVQGALNRDYTLVMGMVIIYSALLIGMGLVVDLLYAWLDPRIRFGTMSARAAAARASRGDFVALGFIVALTLLAIVGPMLNPNDIESLDWANVATCRRA